MPNTDFLAPQKKKEAQHNFSTNKFSHCHITAEQIFDKKKTLCNELEDRRSTLEYPTVQPPLRSSLLRFKPHWCNEYAR